MDEFGAIGTFGLISPNRTAAGVDNDFSNGISAGGVAVMAPVTMVGGSGQGYSGSFPALSERMTQELRGKVIESVNVEVATARSDRVTLLFTDGTSASFPR